MGVNINAAAWQPTTQAASKGTFTARPFPEMGQQEQETAGYGEKAAGTESRSGMIANINRAMAANPIPASNVGIAGVQAKLTIGEPGDQYEQEADRVAAEVVQRMNAPEAPPITPPPRGDGEDKTIQRKPVIPITAGMPAPREDIQRKGQIVAGNVPDLQADFEKQINQARGGGRPLDAAFRAKIEPAMGADFSGVRVHTDTKADQMSQAIQAKAFTTGSDVFFRQGTYDPGSRGGQELIAHELTHVVQQVAETSRRTDEKGEATEGGGILRRHSAPSRVLQMKGVGGQKIGFKQKNEQEDKAAWEKLKQCWKKAKNARKSAKANIESTLAAKKGKGGFTKYYAEELDKIKDEHELLVDELNKDAGEPIVKILADNRVVVVTVGEGGKETEKEIGEVIKDKDKLYEVKGDVDSTTRETYKKNNPLAEGGVSGEKEYIKDTRGVYTRRYAYHEMDYYQMMDFIMSGELTGRYQMFMSAGEAANTSPQKIPHKDNRKAVSKRRGAKDVTKDLTWEEVAVLHQWKGSGPYQSGVSLTSTSRKEVRSNKGKLFRSDGGFRLKIDLAKVDTTVPIVNDYADEGVSQKPATTTKTRPDKYEFPESATKNRELYIERVKKDWVVEVVYHGASDDPTTFSEIEKVILGKGDEEGVKASVQVIGKGIQAYLNGFEKGMKGEDYKDGGKEGELGAEAGKNALAGYKRGMEERVRVGKVAQPDEALEELTAYERKKVPKEHKYDAHKVGYMRGRCTEKEMFKTVEEYGAAIKG
jgi:hypothetical protein